MLDDIVVRRAVSQIDLEKVYEIRYRGYGKYLTEPAQIRESLDQSPNSLLLLATDTKGTALGTLRILDRRYGPIELDSYVPVEKLPLPKPHLVGEATRFSVPACPTSEWIKLSLWKAYFHYCRDMSLRTMLIWIRRSAERDYKKLLFEKIHGGSFSHPILGSRIHNTWALDVATLKAQHKECNHLLYSFFHEEQHPNIRYD